MTATLSPGKDMLIADMLCRAILQTATQERDRIEEKVIYAVMTYQPQEGAVMQQLRTTTDRGSDMQLLQKLHRDGWPDKKKNAPLRAQLYVHIRDILYIDIIPREFRAEILKRLHIAHQGIQRTLAYARAFMYWPGLTSNVHMMVESCTSYQEIAIKRNHSYHTGPDTPWPKITADIFEFQGHSFLLIVDDYSEYPKVLSYCYTKV